MPEIDAETFRRELAGLTDPDTHDESRAAEYRGEAVRLCVVLARIYSRDLDRLKLWDRIASGLASASAKVYDGDTDRYLEILRDHVKAEPEAAARDHKYQELLLGWTAQPLAWRQGLVRYIRLHLSPVLVHGRFAWEQEKRDLKDEAAYRKGGTLSTGEIVEKGIAHE